MSPPRNAFGTLFWEECYLHFFAFWLWSVEMSGKLRTSSNDQLQNDKKVCPIVFFSHQQNSIC